MTEYKDLAEKNPPPVPCRPLDVGEEVQLGDLFLTVDGSYLPLDKTGRLLGITCLGQPINRDYVWFRPEKPNHED